MIAKVQEVRKGEKASGIEIPEEVKDRETQIGIKEAEFIFKHHKNFSKLLEEMSIAG